jgi:hypothetical protein
MNNLIIPEGWTFCNRPENIRDRMPKTFSSYKGALLIVASHGFFSIHATIRPADLFRLEEYLRKKYGDISVEWILYSIPHTNFRENKGLIKQSFLKFGVEDNLFQTDSIGEIITELESVKFRDDTASIKKSAEAFTQAITRFMGFDSYKTDLAFLEVAVLNLCLNLAFYRDFFLEEAMEESLNNEKSKTVPYLCFDEEIYEKFKPLIRRFPWAECVAAEIAKDIRWIIPTPEDSRDFLKRFNDGTGPFYMYDERALSLGEYAERLENTASREMETASQTELFDDEPGESFGGPLEGLRGHEGGEV